MQTKFKNIITLHSLGSNEFSSISFVRIFLSGEKKNDQDKILCTSDVSDSV